MTNRLFFFWALIFVSLTTLAGIALYNTYPVWMTAATFYRIFTWTILLACLHRLNKLLLIGQQDRIAREISLLELKTAADTLTIQTAEIAENVKKRESTAAEKVHDQLAIIDQKVEENTKETRKAAEASAEAASVANSVNEKIANTNAHLVEVLKVATNGKPKLS
jgi:hypothetical protein